MFTKEEIDAMIKGLSDEMKSGGITLNQTNTFTECCRCETELDENTVEYDYMGNEWCKECLDEETNREHKK